MRERLILLPGWACGPAALEPLAEHDLEDVAGADVLESALDHPSMALAARV